MSMSSLRLPLLTPWLGIGVPITPSSGATICQNSLENSGKYYLYLVVYYKDILKNRNEQPSEEGHKLRSRSVLSPGASVGVYYSSSPCVYSPT